MHEFRIRLGLKPDDVYIEMDGERLQGVTSVTIEATAQDQVGKVTLTITGLVQAEVAFEDSQVIQAERPLWDFSERGAGKQKSAT